MKSATRQQLFARLKSQTNGRIPLIRDPGFGLFLEHKLSIDLMENVIELGLKRYCGVKSCAEIRSKDLAKLLGEYEEWRKDQ